MGIFNYVDDSRDHDIIYPLQSKPLGLTWADWTSKWWQWLLSIPKEKNPIIGNERHNFYFNQRNKDVIFLVGTLGGADERRYVIPSGKPVLFPIINFITSYIEEPELKTDLELMSRARKDMNDVVKKEAIIDGVNVENLDKYRVQSQVFELAYSQNNVFELPPVSTKAVSDGYWLFLKPLSVGSHHIHAIGSCSSGKTKVDITWHLDVRECCG